MAFVKVSAKELDQYANMDLDELLGKLTEEEIEQLGLELIDPDDPCVPPNQRCAYKMDKEPTGPFDRKHLLDFIEKKAREEKDWEDPKPFTKEIRGKVWKPKDEVKTVLNDDAEVETEWDEVLVNATEEELVDLAAILGFHGMLNQVQYHQAFVEKRESGEGSGFSGVAKPEGLKLYEVDTPNSTNVDEALEQLKSNDPKLKELNLNNIKNISLEKLKEIATALKENTNLEKLHMANVRATDRVAKKIAESLHDNKTLQVLNLESNYVSGSAIVELLKGINAHQSVTEFKIANQRPSVLGHKIEKQIADLLEENKTILKFGIFPEIQSSKVRFTEYVQRNNDRARTQRTGKADKKDEE